jgi:hypothetical protein
LLKNFSQTFFAKDIIGFRVKLLIHQYQIITHG